MPNTIKASIIGVTGYTGLELVRLMLAHPNIEIQHLVSRQDTGQDLGQIYPHLSGFGLTLTDLDPVSVAKDSDVVFLALPHKTAQETVAALYGKTKIIDLSADFRLDDVKTYEQYYNVPHNHPSLLENSVYGAAEFYREELKDSDIVANPGCFALLAQLLLYPFAGNIESADIFAITGSSGAGKSASAGTHHPIRNHNIKSYNINKHRHIPEISRTAKIAKEQLNFIPSSGPFTRGIFMNAIIRLKKTDVQNTMANYYKDEPFIRITDNVELANIVGSNFADLSFKDGHNNTIIAQGALDNIVKGASGCAIQNMNLIFGLDETTGLKKLSPLYP